MTYDDRQMAAVRIRCAGCGIEYDVTQNWGPRTHCLECRWVIPGRE